MVDIPLLTLLNKATDEVYFFIDKYLRPLPKNDDGTINFDMIHLQHNDIDALRHAYVSGVFTMEYSEKAANFFGKLNEKVPWGYIGASGANKEKAENMDLWNNSVGRKYGKKAKSREELFKFLLEALKKGELIIDLNDSRKYLERPESAKIKDRVVVLEESKTGENILFLDTQTLLVFSREDFVAKIKAGEYENEYEVRIVKGKEIPASKRDGHSNLG